MVLFLLQKEIIFSKKYLIFTSGAELISNIKMKVKFFVKCSNIVKKIVG